MITMVTNVQSTTMMTKDNGWVHGAEMMQTCDITDAQGELSVSGVSCTAILVSCSPSKHEHE